MDSGASTTCRLSDNFRTYSSLSLVICHSSESRTPQADIYCWYCLLFLAFVSRIRSLFNHDSRWTDRVFCICVWMSSPEVSYHYDYLHLVHSILLVLNLLRSNKSNGKESKMDTEMTDFRFRLLLTILKKDHLPTFQDWIPRKSWIFIWKTITDLKFYFTSYQNRIKISQSKIDKLDTL